MEGLKEYIDLQIAEGIPYLDVIAYKKHTEKIRYCNRKYTVSQDENLYMFSITKPFTVSCALKLIEEGKLGLDDPVANYIPEFKNAYLLNEEKKAVKPKHCVTLKHLFTMTAGLTYNKSIYPMDEAISRRGEQSVTRAIAGSLAKAPLSFEPGEKFQYSLCTMSLAQLSKQRPENAFPNI